MERKSSIKGNKKCLVSYKFVINVFNWLPFKLLFLCHEASVVKKKTRYNDKHLFNSTNIKAFRNPRIQTRVAIKKIHVSSRQLTADSWYIVHQMEHNIAPFFRGRLKL